MNFISIGHKVELIQTIFLVKKKFYKYINIKYSLLSFLTTCTCARSKQNSYTFSNFISICMKYSYHVFSKENKNKTDARS